jgi:hypothetical protein
MPPLCPAKQGSVRLSRRKRRHFALTRQDAALFGMWLWVSAAALLKRDGFSSNRRPALAYCWSMMFSDLPSPAEASTQLTNCAKGFAQAGNRYPLFGIML